MTFVVRPERDDEPRENVRQAALELATKVSRSTGRKYVVRDDYGTFLVVLLYEEDCFRPGRDSNRHDEGYAALGLLVKESL